MPHSPRQIGPAAASCCVFGLLFIPEDSKGAVAWIQEFFSDELMAWVKQNTYLVFLAVWGLLRAMGATVQTGNTGLFFSFGRVTRVLEPGFVFKIPYFQIVKTMPTRARTMDVPNQKVTSRDGLVWFVDMNLVYRVVDIRKALIEIDDLKKGMKQILGISVQEIVRASHREHMRLSGGLDEQLKQAMAVRLKLWGVEVESAGFTSIKPSTKTLRFTQQKHATEERLKALQEFEAAGLTRTQSLAMLGNAPIPRRRGQRAVERESMARRHRRILRGVRTAERASELRLTARMRGRLRQATTVHLKADGALA